MGVHFGVEEEISSPNAEEKLVIATYGSLFSRNTLVSCLCRPSPSSYVWVH